MIPSEATLAGVRIVVAVTAPSSASFYDGQLAALRADGAEVYFLSSPSDEVARQCAAEGAEFVPIALERAPAPVRDVAALVRISAALQRLRPDVVNAGTPKAGLLCTLAAAALRVPHRIHTLHGLRYETAHGASRRVLWLAQRTSCSAATDVVCVSPSLRDQAVATGVLAVGRGVVLGNGTVNGVDVARFSRREDAARAGSALRASLGIGPDQRVVGYLGRLARDKGLGDLAEAWSLAGGRGAHLLVSGEVDVTDPPAERDLEFFRTTPSITMTGQIDPVAFHAAIDVLVMPSYREGFPTPPLEAAAMGRPVIATRVTGCVDAVRDGITGLLVPSHDPPALAQAMTRYLEDVALAHAHGDAGSAWVATHFERSAVHRQTVEFYRRVVRSR